MELSLHKLMTTAALTVFASLCFGTTTLGGGYVAINPGVQRMGLFSIDAVNYQTLVNKASTTLSFSSVEHAVSVLSMDAAAKVGLGSFGVEADGTYVTVVADSMRCYDVPVLITQANNAYDAFAVVGVSCRIRFVTRAFNAKAGLEGRLGLSFSYRAETLNFGAYGFRDYEPFELSFSSQNGSIDIVETRNRMIQLFNAYNKKADKPEFQPMLLGFRLPPNFPAIGKDTPIHTVTVVPSPIP